MKKLRTFWARIMVWCFVASIYGFTFGMWVSAIAGVRGILPWRSTGDHVAHGSYLVGAWGALVGGVILIVGAASALRAERPVDPSGPPRS